MYGTKIFLFSKLENDKKRTIKDFQGTSHFRLYPPQLLISCFLLPVAPIVSPFSCFLFSFLPTSQALLATAPSPSLQLCLLPSPATCLQENSNQVAKIIRQVWASQVGQGSLPGLDLVSPPPSKAWQGKKGMIFSRVLSALQSTGHSYDFAL